MGTAHLRNVLRHLRRLSGGGADGVWRRGPQAGCRAGSVLRT